MTLSLHATLTVQCCTSHWCLGLACQPTIANFSHITRWTIHLTSQVIAAALQAISAHFLWLSYLQEQWAIISRLRDARTAAARVMYGRLLAASLHDPAVLSHHPAAVGAYFRLLTLGLKYGRSCLRGGPATAGKDVLLLFDRILQAVSTQRLLDLCACFHGLCSRSLFAWCMRMPVQLACCIYR